MKKVFAIFFGMMLAVCLCSCASSAETVVAGEEEKTITASKIIGPSAEIVAPTSNAKAMEAYNTGSLLMYDEKYAEAEPYLRLAIELDPGYVDAYDHLGRTLRMLGRPEEAIEILEKSISLMPDNDVPYTSLCLAYEDINDLQSAIDTCNRAIQNIPYDPEGYYNAGVILYEYGYLEDAIWYLLRAAKLYMDEGSEYIYDATYNLGFAYFALEDWENAEMYLGYTLSAYPDNEVLQQYYLEAARKAAEIE